MSGTPRCHVGQGLGGIILHTTVVAYVSRGIDPHCRIVKLVRAMRKGWLKKQDDKPPEKPPVYLLWQDDGLAADHTQAGEPRVLFRV